MTQDADRDSQPPVRGDADSEPQAPAKSPRKRRRDRIVYAVFAAVLIAVCTVIYLHQRSGPSLDWPEYDAQSLPGFLSESAEASRPVILLFKTEPPSAATKKLIRDSLLTAEVTRWLEKRNIAAGVVVVDAQCEHELARKYEVSELPTLVTFSSKGDLVERKSGFVGRAPVQQMLRKADEADQER